MSMPRKSIVAFIMLCLAVTASVGIFTPRAEGAAPGMGALRHIVLLNFKDDAKPEQLAGLADAAKALKAAVPEIQTLELGENLAANTRSEGYTHCLFVTFKDEAGLNVYGPSEGHETFKKALLPLVEKVLVFDYVAN